MNARRKKSGANSNRTPETAAFPIGYESDLELASIGDEITEFEPIIENPKDIKILQQARLDNKLVLVLGAGISVPLKLRKWNELNAALFQSVLPRKYARFTPALIREIGLPAPVLTRFVEGQSRLRAEFRRRLKVELYHSYRSKFSNATMKQVVNLLTPKRTKPPVSTVLTYNFDDVLELALQHLQPNLKFDSIGNEKDFARASKALRIFHPHGLLPFSDDESYSHLESSLVFSEPEFHEQYFSFRNWEHLIQNFVYSTKVCLFIGISFSDPNLRRHLDLAKSLYRAGGDEVRHYAIVATPSRRLKRDLATLVGYFRHRDLASMGVTPLWVTSYERGIPRILASIAKKR